MKSSAVDPWKWLPGWLKNEREWNRWFAWRPVVAISRAGAVDREPEKRLVWLETVECKCTYTAFFGSYWCYRTVGAEGF